MNYAIISDGGKQFKVEEGQLLDIDFRPVSIGESIQFDQVLAARNESGIRIGQPVLAGAQVLAEVVSPVKGPKLVVQKFRRRKNSRRRTGHRQIYTRVKINQIEIP
ncbi:MAG: 50S ribosomal protein L21 [Pirellulales bacterium]|nr:50S ribosomal protein L21 [Pirellulales bacterium]